MAGTRTVYLGHMTPELAECERAVLQVFDSLGGWQVVRGREQVVDRGRGGAMDVERIADCTLFVGVVGHCYGAGGDALESPAEAEYRAAVRAGVPRLMFIANDEFRVPAGLWEGDALRQRIAAFRMLVGRDPAVESFSSAGELDAKLRRALQSWRPAPAGAPATAPEPSSVLGGGPLRPPQPDLVHPYALQPHFTGRVAERRSLTQWLVHGEEPVFCLTALGGMGKSALTWAWLQRDVLGQPLPGVVEDQSSIACRVPERARPDGVLWWSFYEPESSFSAMVRRALDYLGGDQLTVPDAPHERIRLLLELLAERRALLMFDGFERVLRAYVRLDALYLGEQHPGFLETDHPRDCVDPLAGEFLSRAAELPLRGRIVVTTRLLPAALEGRGGCRDIRLTGLSTSDAEEFLRVQGVTGSPAEIRQVCQRYGGHGLTLRVLAGLIIRDPQRPGDVRVAADLTPEAAALDPAREVLSVALEALRPPLRAFLGRLAAFRSPVDERAIFHIAASVPPDRVRAALAELVERGLLFHDRDRGRYDLHPVVRSYAYALLTSPKDVHERLRTYFAAIPPPAKSRVHSVDDLWPVIELYHHTVRAGRYDEARALLRDRLVPYPLYYQLGAYQLCVELLLALFPDGEDAPPALSGEWSHAWTLNELANAYSLSGRPGRAVPLFERLNGILERLGDRRNLTAGLGNLATEYIILGRLKDADACLRRRIDLGLELSEPMAEAIGRQELALLLACRGEFDKSEAEFTRAMATFEAQESLQSQCIVWAYRAVRHLLMGEPEAALSAAQRSAALADERRMVRDVIRADWLLGATKTAVATAANRPQLLDEADGHLTAALTRCCEIGMADHEADILLAIAEWHWAREQPDEARARARAALDIADRCGYRLKQADAHLFLARLATAAGDEEEARAHAAAAVERARCDGEPFCYRPILRMAEELVTASEETTFL